MQQLTILGNIGRDAVVRDANDQRVISFSVACNERYKDKQGQPHERTTWYEVSMWRTQQQSTGIAQYLTKGQGVLVVGAPSVRSYTDRDGRTAFSLDVRANNIELAGGKPQGQQPGQPVHVDERPQQLAPHRDAQPEPAGHPAVGDDNDLPF